MGDFTFNLSPDIIDADLQIASQLLSSAEKQEVCNSAMLNMCGYHAAQAIEKSLKLLFYTHAPEVYRQTDLCNTHSIPAILYPLHKEMPQYEERHKEVAAMSKQLSLFNIARYGDYTVTRNEAKKAVQLATELYSDVVHELGRPIQSSQKKELCNNEVYITQAIDLIEKSMQKLYEVDTPNGKVNPSDGYTINNIKQGYLHIQVDVTMLSRSKEKGEKPNNGDRCTFYVSKGRVYDSKQWVEKNKVTPKPPKNGTAKDDV